ncbi:hypothetical protein [Nonomuraea indica]|uniref:PH domain-containing protein n=1 Tax=Nonomuraea indica TaxID=1581193 RepID=A0ABW8A3U6_9ACTN
MMQQVWRVSYTGRIAGVLGALISTGVFIVLGWSGAYVAGGDGPDAFISALVLIGAGLLCGSAAVYCCLQSVRPCIMLTDDSVIVRNPYKTQHISLAGVARVSAGYDGICITMRDGSQIVAWAVQKSNLARWLGRRTRADAVVDRLMDAATAAHGNGGVAETS